MLNRLLAALLVGLGYILGIAALLPGLLVVIEHGLAQYVGGWLWTAVVASLLVSAGMLSLTLRLRDRFCG